MVESRYELAHTHGAFDPECYFASEFAEHQEVVAASRRELIGSCGAMLRIWTECIRRGGKILFFGNGGSAADAAHIAAELSVRYSCDRRALPALALANCLPVATAAGNDFGYHTIFARQVEALGAPGDVAVGITTSGRSANVIEALKTARAKKLVTAAFTGNAIGEVSDIAETVIAVPSLSTARIQEAHILIGHMLCGALEHELELV